MNGTGQHFEAFIYHPDFGNEVVDGRIYLDFRTLTFESAATTLKIPIEQLVVSLGKKDDERVYFNDRNQPDLKFFTADSAILEHPTLAKSPHIRNQLATILGHRELRRRLLTTFYFLITCGVIAWVGSLASSVIVRSFVKKIPMEWEMKFGNSVIKQLEDDATFLNDSNKVAQLTAAAQPLIQTIQAKNLRFTFHIMESPFPNAFALPGGHIVVSTGLLEMTDKPEELLGVIAHETAHVTQRHAIRHLISARDRSSFYRFAWAAGIKCSMCWRIPRKNSFTKASRRNTRRKLTPLGGIIWWAPISIRMG
ncbi:MAG: M48 family metallopeptidase [Limisphaerales bacterium]